MRPTKLTTRRAFLHRGLTLAGGPATARVVLGRSTPPSPAADGAHSQPGAGAMEDRVLVVVQLTGGNDGLNTVIPVGDDLYYKYRPQLAIDRKTALRIDDACSLHPALKGLRSLYDDGLLAIVQGVGYPNPNRSHFKSMTIWHTASADGRESAGWLGRYFDSTYRDEDGCGSRLALALTSDIPPAMCGERFLPAAFAGPASPLANSLRTIARMVASNAPTRIYYVSQGGFDTHTGQANRHPRLLGQLGDALKDFADDLAAAGRLDRVVVMAFSEFGRRVAENASGGTDHGEAGPMFVIGGQVRPGLHGRPCSLGKLHRGDLIWTTDFRRVYAAILAGWLGTDPKCVLGEAFTPLPILQRA